MRLNVYSIFDVAAGAYARPFFLQSDAAAMRLFGDEAVGADNPISAHPEDYSLFRIGTFDDQKGRIEGEPHECLATALEVVAQRQKVDKAAVHNLEVELEKSSAA
jgi:hypothetical protein